jgi:hypothetical protein
VGFTGWSSECRPGIAQCHWLRHRAVMSSIHCSDVRLCAWSFCRTACLSTQKYALPPRFSQSPPLSFVLCHLESYSRSEYKLISQVAHSVQEVRETACDTLMSSSNEGHLVAFGAQSAVMDKQEVLLALVFGLIATIIASLSLLIVGLQLIHTRQAQARVPTNVLHRR